MAQRPAIALYPWLENGDLSVDGVMDQLDEYCRIAAAFCPGAFIVTSSWFAPRVSALRRRLNNPAFGLIPGIKVGNEKELLSDFADAAAWGRIAQAVPGFISATGATHLALECETALLDYSAGKQTIDPARLTRALKQLPRDVRYVWYPGALGVARDIPAAYYRMMRLWSAVEEGLPWVRFTTWGLSHAPWLGENPDWVFRDEVIRRYCTQMVLDNVYVGRTDKKGYWPPERIRDALRLVKSPDAFLWFPWTTARENLTALREQFRAP